ncbi:MAG: protein-disulfide reductase DsbD domain-containing protein, partial [Kangiellaceae bacterium]|nr:protein-disulfide reductase DsbD domain-containing protein [Kangiellaceae bacterium]
MGFIKNIFLSASTFLFLLTVTAQSDENPAVWSHEVNELSEREYELVFKADIYKDWFIYSLYTAEGGSMPSEFEFVGAGEDYELLGKTEEGKTYKKYTEVFDVEETFFKEKALFKQKIRLLKEDVSQIEVILYYQICKEVCVLKEEVFTISLDGGDVVLENGSLDERSLAMTNALKLDLKYKERLEE